MHRVELIENNGVLEVLPIDPISVKQFEESHYNNRMFAYLELWKDGTTTKEQRKHYWAIIKDICQHLGITKGEARLHTYARYMADNDKDDIISMAIGKASKQEATLLIQACIDFCIDNEIPLNNDYSSYFEDRQYYSLIMKRKCFICGNYGDIAHVEAVGAGRDRRTIDHSQHHLMCLCREHHTEQHKIGINSFMAKYQLKGIKLKKEDLKKLGVG